MYQGGGRRGGEVVESEFLNTVSSISSPRGDTHMPCEKIILKNFTPHDITIYDKNGNEVIMSIPSSGVARVDIHEKEAGDINGIPVVETEYGEVEGLPEGEECTVYIVSSMVLDRVKDQRNDIVAPDTSPKGSVRDESNRILGVKRLRR